MQSLHMYIPDLKELAKIVIVQKVFLVISKVLLYKRAVEVKWCSLAQRGGTEHTTKVF